MDNNEDTYTITGGPLKPHEYVVIRREMTAGDEAWIQNHASKLTGDRKNPQLQLTVGDVRLAALKRMITAWHLTRADSTGQQAPIALSEQAIENLPRRISSFINKVIDELNPEDEESDEDFTHAANGSSGGSSHQRNIVPLKP
jgi:hypothetical protein